MTVAAFAAQQHKADYRYKILRSQHVMAMHTFGTLLDPILVGVQAYDKCVYETPENKPQANKQYHNHAVILAYKKDSRRSRFL